MFKNLKIEILLKLKIYLAIAIVLRCYKKCPNFLWYFDGNSPVIICSQFSFKTKIVPFQHFKIANWFSFRSVVQQWPENILRKHSFFFFTLQKIKYRSNFAPSSNFAVTRRKMIIYTGNQTLPFGIMSFFRTKLYMPHLHSFFWFLLTILRKYRANIYTLKQFK